MPDVWEATTSGKSVSREGMDQVARELVKVAGEKRIWLLYGEMGTGKTTLIKAIGRHLGVTESMSSPTFSIVHEYSAVGGARICHFDLYRIKNDKELFEIGMEEYFDSGDYCLVEWPEKLGSLAPRNSFNIRITATDPEQRTIDYQPL